MTLKWFKKSLRRIPPDTTVPILFGPSRGSKWIVGASRNAYWLGLYEREKGSLFAEQVQPGDVVYDVGAHVGYYSLLASERVGTAGRVIAFEPLPANLSFLFKHLELNHCSNVRVIEAAVTDGMGTGYFRLHPSRSMGNLALQGDLQVKTVSLDALWAKQELPLPQIIKMDIEGAEGAALRGAQQILTTTFPKLFVATHATQVHQDVCAFLKEIGYQVNVLEWLEREQRGEVYAYKGQE